MYKYEEIVRDIEECIADGTLKPYAKLPPVTELCSAYGVSKSTINQVLQTLSDEGLISRRQGSGIYVKAIETSSIGWKGPNQVVQIAPRAAKMPSNDSIDVIDFNVIRPESRISRLLGINGQSFLYFVTRMHRNGPLPTCMEYVYLPIESVGSLSLAAAGGDVTTEVTKHSGVPVGSFEKTVRSVLSTNDERARLKLEYGTPLLEVEEVGYLMDGKPFGVFIKRFPGDRFEFKATGSDASSSGSSGKGL